MREAQTYADRALKITVQVDGNESPHCVWVVNERVDLSEIFFHQLPYSFPTFPPGKFEKTTVTFEYVKAMPKERKR